jgi:hypothetical protein
MGSAYLPAICRYRKIFPKNTVRTFLGQDIQVVDPSTPPGSLCGVRPERHPSTLPETGETSGRYRKGGKGGEKIFRKKKTHFSTPANCRSRKISEKFRLGNLSERFSRHDGGYMDFCKNSSSEGDPPDRPSRPTIFREGYPDPPSRYTPPRRHRAGPVGAGRVGTPPGTDPPDPSGHPPSGVARPPSGTPPPRSDRLLPGGAPMGGGGPDHPRDQTASGASDPSDPPRDVPQRGHPIDPFDTHPS